MPALKNGLIPKPDIAAAGCCNIEFGEVEQGKL